MSTQPGTHGGVGSVRRLARRRRLARQRLTASARTAATRGFDSHGSASPWQRLTASTRETATRGFDSHDGASPYATTPMTLVEVSRSMRQRPSSPTRYCVSRSFCPHMMA